MASQTTDTFAEQPTIIFTDGSSRGNPGPGGWGAIIIENEMVRELGGGEATTTNNRMEIMAALQAISSSQSANIKIYSDSSYLIKGATQWVFGWQKNGWRTATKEEVQNQDLWQALIKAMMGKKIEWQYVGGHVGIVGNERCDVIATAFADQKNFNLFNGAITEYPYKDILDIKANDESVQQKSSSRKRNSALAYSYISMVNGKIETHKTWPECEERVRGKSGARYKKSVSPSDEEAIIAEFLKLK